MLALVTGRVYSYLNLFDHLFLDLSKLCIDENGNKAYPSVHHPIDFCLRRSCVQNLVVVESRKLIKELQEI